MLLSEKFPQVTTSLTVQDSQLWMQQAQHAWYGRPGNADRHQPGRIVVLKVRIWVALASPSQQAFTLRAVLTSAFWCAKPEFSPRSVTGAAPPKWIRAWSLAGGTKRNFLDSSWNSISETYLLGLLPVRCLSLQGIVPTFSTCWAINKLRLAGIYSS